MRGTLRMAFKQMSDADRRAVVAAALDQVRTQEPQRVGLYLMGAFYMWDGTVIDSPDSLADVRRER